MNFKEVSKKLKEMKAEVKAFSDFGIEKVERISTGSISLDYALGIGGYPRGRIIEIFGKEMSGKSLITLVNIATAQKLGYTCLLIDAEHAFDPKWASTLGADVDKLFYYQPDYGEDAFDKIEKAIDAGIDLIVVDSTAALIPKEELEADIDKSQMALQARMMSKMLRRVTQKQKVYPSIVVFINQIRENITVMYGDRTTTPGGNALKFYSSIRIQVSKISGSEIYNEKKEVIGHKIRIRVKKNKVAPPFKEAEMTVNFLTGLNKRDELLNLALQFDVIKCEGRTYYFNDKKIVGRNNLSEKLTDKDYKQIENILNDVFTKE